MGSMNDNAENESEYVEKAPESSSQDHTPGVEYMALRYSQKEGYENYSYKSHPSETVNLHQILLDLGYTLGEANQLPSDGEQETVSGDFSLYFKEIDKVHAEWVLVRDSFPIFCPTYADCFALMAQLAPWALLTHFMEVETNKEMRKLERRYPSLRGPRKT